VALPVEITHLIYDQLRAKQLETTTIGSEQAEDQRDTTTIYARDQPAVGPSAAADEDGDRQMSIVLQLREWFPELEEAEIQRYSNCHA